VSKSVVSKLWKVEEMGSRCAECSPLQVWQVVKTIRHSLKMDSFLQSAVNNDKFTVIILIKTFKNPSLIAQIVCQKFRF